MNLCVCGHSYECYERKNEKMHLPVCLSVILVSFFLSVSLSLEKYIHMYMYVCIDVCRYVRMSN